MMDFREYEFDLQLFGRAETERVRVFAESRDRGFTAAALHAVDPDNVYSLTLVRDGDHSLSADRWRPSPEENKLGSLPGGRTDLFRNSCRAYVVQMRRFTDPGDRLQESIGAPRRADAFTAAVVVSGYWDIRVARLVAVGSDERATEYHWLDPRCQYGGTVLDLECVLPRDQAAVPARETTREAGRAKSRGRGTVVPRLPLEEEEEEENVKKLALDSEGYGTSVMTYDSWLRRRNLRKSEWKDVPDKRRSAADWSWSRNWRA